MPALSKMEDQAASPRTRPQPDVAATSAGRRYALRGLLVRKERWTLSAPGKVLLLVTLVASALFVSRSMHSFLAVTHRTSGDILVVDGWMPTYTLEQVAVEGKTGAYQHVVVVRALYDGKNRYDSGQFVADYMAEHLVQLGVPQNRVETLFLQVARKDRTYSSAVAVRKWFQDQGIKAGSLNVATLGAHARRSRLLYEKAFGDGFDVGVVAIDDRTYDGARWWHSSEGVREVPFELVAYLYAKLFFSPN